MPAGPTPAVPQLPLALRHSPDQRLETFVGAPSGAIAQLDALALGRSADATYVSGPAGSGRTHLLLGTCAAAQAAGRRAAYVGLAPLVGRLSQALQAFEGMDVLALDDLDAVAGRRDDEVALFDLHNRARAAGCALVYAALARPESLGLSLPDLRSRLAQCSAIVLAPLDETGRREVLRERAARRGLALDDTALDWLLRRVERDLGSLTAVLDRLDREALAAQRRLTVPFLRQVLGATPGEA
ncbi:DnaA regulatory inactivator Hda [Lysobacter humi (ex Lee et al. 2017)]